MTTLYNLKESISDKRYFLMGISIVMIMLYHQLWVFNPLLKPFSYYGYNGADLFFFLSGFGLTFSFKGKTPTQFYRRRLSRILPTCIVCGLCKLLITYFVSGFPPLVNALLMIFGLDLWFIRALFIFYLFFPLFHHAAERWGEKCLLAVLVLIPFAFLYTSQDTFSGFYTRIPAFFLGILAAKGMLTINKFTLTAYAIAFFLSLYLRRLDWLNIWEFRGILTIYQLLFSISTPFVLYALTHLYNILHKVLLATIFCWLGAFTLELYLWHEYIYHLTDIFKPLSPQNGWQLLTIGFFCSIGFAFAQYHLMKKLHL